LSGCLGVAYGICTGGALRSMALLRLPTPQQPLQGECFPLVPEADWPLRTAFLEHAMVSPQARRCGHQQALICARSAYAKRCAGVRWIAAGVQLGNPTSWRNLMRGGLVIVKSRTRAGRTQLALLMSVNAALLTTRPSDQRWVIGHEPEAHAAALDAGYFGVRPGLGGTVIYQRRDDWRCAAGDDARTRSSSAACQEGMA
jgi:hypothetical protein